MNTRADYNERLKSNPLQTREDLEQSLNDMYEPLFHLLKQQKKGHLYLGTSGSVYRENTREIEAFLRPLWGWGPLLSVEQDKYPEVSDAIVEGIIAGTDPKHASYWGNTNDYDQLFVEMASLSLAMILAKPLFWDSLTKMQQENLANWLRQINQHVIPNTNWLFFRILVNVALHKCGKKWDEQRMKADLNKIDDFYLHDGWYFDGYESQIDYYIPFAMHFYGLVYAKVMETEDPGRSKQYKERARIFAQSYKEWFSTSGAAIPFGRSLTYRFAQSSFWSALVFAGVEALPWGEIKSLVLRNLRYWLQQPIFSSDGLLTIGYAYQNLNMAEGYNAPGSPYWAFKTFLLLGIPKDHPFWQAEESALVFSEKSVQKSARMVICHEPTGKEVQAFVSGQHCHEHAHADAKYEKLVYSTSFGFSIPKGNLLLKQGAFDSCFALSECDGHYRTRYGCESFEINEAYITSVWKPWQDVTITTIIVPLMPWHVRIHFIDTKRELDTAEGGFAAPGGTGKSVENGDRLFYQFDNGVTGIMDYSGIRNPNLIVPEPNTNLLFSQSVIPTLTARIQPGQHLFISAVLGSTDSKENIESNAVPNIMVNNSILVIAYQEKKIVIDISAFDIPDLEAIKQN